MNQKITIMKYRSFCGEKKKRAFASCLKIFGTYFYWQNLQNEVAEEISTPSLYVGRTAPKGSCCRCACMCTHARTHTHHLNFSVSCPYIKHRVVCVGVCVIE
jgi:hypothetical protein